MEKIKKSVIALSAAFIVMSAQMTAFAAELPEKLVPMGTAVGISIRTEGALVSELSSAETADGTLSPAKDAGILPGDIITMVGDKAVTDARSLTEALSGCGGENTPVRVVRGGEEMQLVVKPCSIDGGTFIGVWVRDSMTGIGTLTFFDPDTNVFGALGHSVSDVETNVLIPVKDGVIMSASISGITPGQAGTPGQLGGLFNAENAMGDIYKNSGAGIFGRIYEDTVKNIGGTVPVGGRSDIKTGKATILSTIDGETPSEYEIEITRVYAENGEGRSMMIKVTDEELLRLTGGIVQGMSGSPILQGGKLVGAVTHVMINDPTRGYGIAIGDMLETAYDTEEKAA